MNARDQKLVRRMAREYDWMRFEMRDRLRPAQFREMGKTYEAVIAALAEARAVIAKAGGKS